ncbi:hypothetical protein [Chryseobacterium wanjuense]
MKITFLATELNNTNIIIPPVDFYFAPVIGDYVAIIDFIEDKEKEIFSNYLKDNNKINLATVDGRIWNKTNGENTLQLSLYFDDDK